MASFIGKVHFLRFFCLVEEQNWTECQRCPESIIEAGYGLSKEYTSKDFPKKLTCGVNCILKWVLFSTPFFYPGHRDQKMTDKFGFSSINTVHYWASYRVGRVVVTLMIDIRNRLYHQIN